MANQNFYDLTCKLEQDCDDFDVIHSCLVNVFIDRRIYVCDYLNLNYAVFVYLKY